MQPLLTLEWHIKGLYIIYNTSLICSSKEWFGILYPQMSKRCHTNLEKMQHLHYLINSLLPFLKKISQEQAEEMVWESVCKGICL